MGIEVKTKTRFSSYNIMYGLSRFFRGLGWFALLTMFGFSIPSFFSNYSYMSQSKWYADHALQWAVEQTFEFLIFALVLAACSFLLSVMLYTGLMLVSQRRAQIALLERLVRERHETLSVANTIVLLEHL